MSSCRDKWVCARGLQSAEEVFGISSCLVVMVCSVVNVMPYGPRAHKSTSNVLSKPFYPQRMLPAVDVECIQSGPRRSVFLLLVGSMVSFVPLFIDFSSFVEVMHHLRWSRMPITVESEVLLEGSLHWRLLAVASV